MRNSTAILDVNGKGNIGLVSVMVPATASVKVNKLTIDEKQPMQANLLHLAAVALMSAAQKTEWQGKRISLLVPDSIAIRTFEALAHKAESAEAISSYLFKDWMAGDQHADAYAKATSEYAQAFKAALAKNITVNLVNSRTLYRFELTGNLEKLADMTEITLTNSVNTELGISVRQGEMSYCNGTYKIQKQTRRGQNGSFDHFYIARMVGIIDAEGKRQRVPVGVAAAMDGIQGTNDSYSTLINVAKFRSIAAKELPRTEVIAAFKVEVA